MAQNAALRAMDAAIHASLARADIAETGTYTPPTPPGGAAVSVRAYRDDVVLEEFGDVRGVVNTRTELSLLRSDVAQPLKGGTVLLDGTTWTLVALLEQDQSLSRWVVNA